MYTYSRLAEDLSYLSYNGFDVGSIGLSTLKNTISYVHIGQYHGGQAIITGGIHPRENVTSLLVMRQAFRAALTRNGLQGGIYFIPMLNPDGALLIEKGAGLVPEKSAFLTGLNEGNPDFSLWKANINGVDLNNNFDARFGLGAGQKDAPAPQGYPGRFAFSEAETAALKSFTISVRPQITLSYHALGREIYWNFFQKGGDYDRDKAIAIKIEEMLGYKRVDSDLDSTGGYKDWCVDFLKIPSFTVEIVEDTLTHPLRDEALEPEWEVNKDIPFLLAETANKLFVSGGKSGV